MRYLLVAIGCLFLLSGCGSSTPQCSDSDVQDLVLEITKEELFKQLLVDELPRHYEDIIKESKDNAVYKEYEQIDSQGMGFVNGRMPVEYFLKFVEVSDTAEIVRDIILSKIEEMAIKLTAIRTSGTDDEVKKCGCKASLAFSNGKTYDIQYTGQTTDDGQIYVEVFGL